jgi:methylthioribose-1-phosphate isomerase
MKVDGKQFRTIWPGDDGSSFEVIDQTKLPHEFVIRKISSTEEAVSAIREMVVRGAPLIGATAAWGVWAALRVDPSNRALDSACDILIVARPTAVNLAWAIDRMRSALSPLPPGDRADAARRLATVICDEDVETNRSIGEHGLRILAKLHAGRGGDEPVNVLTHCNAGWLATVDWGTALAPVYMAHESGIPVHVWVDETRPRNQGSGLTAWELRQHGVPHTVVVDNAGGHLMQQGLVDCCITGTDRTSANGDVCNKIGTYLKALAAHDTGVPFYVALPGPTIDWSIEDGVSGIPIEQRSGTEVSQITGRTADGALETVTVTPPGCEVANYAFDVTPGRLVTALITERGVCAASREGLASLYPN